VLDCLTHFARSSRTAARQPGSARRRAIRSLLPNDGLTPVIVFRYLSFT
jgi:hypothetical protein